MKFGRTTAFLRFNISRRWVFTVLPIVQKGHWEVYYANQVYEYVVRRILNSADAMRRDGARTVMTTFFMRYRSIISLRDTYMRLFMRRAEKKFRHKNRRDSVPSPLARETRERRAANGILISDTVTDVFVTLRVTFKIDNFLSAFRDLSLSFRFLYLSLLLVSRFLV